MTSPSNEEDALVNVKNPDALLALYSEFLRLRSQYIVGKALAEQYVSEQALEDGLTSKEFVQTVDAFAGLVAELRGELAITDPASPEVPKLIAEYYPQSLQAIHDFAEFLNVPGEDVLSVMIHTKVS